MGLKIVAAGESWNLPDNFHLIDAGFKRRMDLVPRVFSDGGIDKGDDMVDIRHLFIEGVLFAKNDGDYDSKWNELMLKLSQEDFYLEDGNWQILIRRAPIIDQRFPLGLRKRISEVEIELVSLDPLWQHKDLSVKEEACPIPPKEFVVTNGGSYIAYPIITITANTNNPTMTLKNITDDNVIFSYADSGFLSGKVLIINCKEGTVELYDEEEGTNTIRYFNGQFLRLLPGDNTIEYDGADADVKFEFHRRRL